MNEPILSAARLEDLLNLAKKAETGFEKAAVYSAACCIESEFRNELNTEPSQINGYDMEKVVDAVWHIKAMVGYDVTNNHSMSQHESWAFGSIMTLKENLEKPE